MASVECGTCSHRIGRPSQSSTRKCVRCNGHVSDSVTHMVPRPLPATTTRHHLGKQSFQTRALTSSWALLPTGGESRRPFWRDQGRIRKQDLPPDIPHLPEPESGRRLLFIRYGSVPIRLGILASGRTRAPRTQTTLVQRAGIAAASSTSCPSAHSCPRRPAKAKGKAKAKERVEERAKASPRTITPPSEGERAHQRRTFPLVLRAPPLPYPRALHRLRLLAVLCPRRVRRQSAPRQ